MKTFEYRLYPNAEQSRLIMQCLVDSRIIYNDMLAATKKHHEESGKLLFKYDLSKMFKGKREHVPASTVQCLANRLDKALMAFLRRKEKGEVNGFPRFKKPNQWHSIHLRQWADYGGDCCLVGNRLKVPKMLGNSIKIKLHRPLEGTPKTCYLVLRADGHWYALIVCQVEKKPECDASCNHKSIGIDVGLKSFLTDSKGNTIDNPRFFRESQQSLRRKQRQLNRRKDNGKRRDKAARNVAKTHLKIQRQRRDFHFKVAKLYADKYRLTAVEKLNIQSMLIYRNLSKSIMDAGWYQFITILKDKAESAGHQVVEVNPHYTSQECYKCGEIVQKSLSVRTHICSHCGYVADRDVNAAKNILKRAKGGGTAFGDTRQ